MWNLHFPRLRRLPGMLMAAGGFAMTIRPSDVVQNIREFVGLYASAPDWISVQTFRPIFAVIMVLGLSWCLWPSKKKPEANGRDDEIKGLYDYFREDFDVISIDNELTLDADPRSRYKVRSLMDYKAGGRYVAIYVPYRESNLSRMCIENFLKNCDALLGLMHGQTQIHFADIGDSRAASANELVFTGRVIVYYEAQLTIKELAELESVARDGINITWRGTQYVTSKFLAKRLNQPNTH